VLVGGPAWPEGILGLVQQAGILSMCQQMISDHLVEELAERIRRVMPL
jgi:hypothetical protein